MRKNEIEILAPAGSVECLKAAITAGADAVYVGGSMFGARAFANNFTEEELLEALDYVHFHGKKLFLTVNTLLKESELKEKLYSYLHPFYVHGLDAVIVQDIGVLKFIRESFPDLPIHASTQMTITGVDGARFLAEQGVQRVVTARELNIKEISKISENVDVEIESFVHGALCYCYSGQCLFSSFLGGRSGNRGQCAQPCRLLYQEEHEKNPQYLLSLKDICTLELIPEMSEAGIYSFKIEGRMKKPEYVAGVVSVYRKYADLYLSGTKNYRVEEQDKEMLMDLYNRGGFHTGYYHTQNGAEMVSLDRPNHAGIPAVKCLKKQGRTVVGKALINLHPQDVIELPMRRGQEKPDTYTCKVEIPKGADVSMGVFSDTPFQKGMVWSRTKNTRLIEMLNKIYVTSKKKQKINGKLILSVHDFVKLTVSNGNFSVKVQGDEVQEARNQPIERERIDKQMRKTGNTEFEFDELDIEINGNIFLPMQNLNELRRKALLMLQEKICSSYYREDCSKQTWQKPEHQKNGRLKGIYTASAMKISQAEVLCNIPEVERIYIDCTAFGQVWKGDVHLELIEKVHNNGKEIYFAMPYIFREDTRKKYASSYDTLFCAGWDGILIRNYESYGFLKEHCYQGKVMTDYNLYQMNSYGKEFWKQEGIYAYTAPVELTARELKKLDIQEGELIIYGHIPMMVTAGCVKKTLGQCKHQSGQTRLTDRYKKTFLVKNECDYCYNIIYNNVPLYLGDKMDEVHQTEPRSVRWMFTIEESEEIERILEAYKQGKVLSESEFTRGHWKNGIK